MSCFKSIVMISKSEDFYAPLLLERWIQTEASGGICSGVLRVSPIFQQTQNKINLKWSNWSDNTSPYCKTCFSTSEWIWHAKNNLVKLHKKWDLGTLSKLCFKLKVELKYKYNVDGRAGHDLRTWYWQSKLPHWSNDKSHLRIISVEEILFP